MHHPRYPSFLRLAAALCLLFTALIIYSCRKSTIVQEGGPAGNVGAPALSVAEARSWYQGQGVAGRQALRTQSSGTPGLEALVRQQGELTLNWDSARLAADSNWQAVEAPARYSHDLGFAVQGGSAGAPARVATRLLVLRQRGTGTMAVALMHIWTSQANAASLLGQVHYGQVPQGFSGSIFYTSQDGAFISGYVYEQGKVVKTATQQAAPKAGSGVQTLNLKLSDDCSGYRIDTYEHTCVYYNDVPVECGEWTYLYSTYFMNCGSGGGGGGGVPAPPQQQIINNVTDSCLHAMVNDIISENVTGKIDSMVQSVFGGQSKLNLTFTDTATITKLNRDAETASVFGSSGNLISSETRLKQSVLAGSSKEYIAATIMHEALHAYINSQGIDLDDHEEMAKKYVDTMAGDLLKMFPGMVRDVAYSLAWGGLEGTTWYSNPGPNMYMPPYQAQYNAYMRAHKVDGQTFGHGCK